MTIPILFEDDSLVVINKPPGIVVNRAQSVNAETVQDWVERSFPSVLHAQTSKNLGIQNISNHKDGNPEYDIVQEFTSRTGIVHRIDKETSGILVIAKTPEAFGSVKQQFMDRSIQKAYQAIVHGQMPSVEGEINVPIDRLPWDKERWGVVPQGKEAVTVYTVISTFQRQSKNKKEDFALVWCYPKTGRTHQIRVHLKYIGHPILGDYLYAGRKTARNDRMWAPRVMLHAAKIVLLHPVTQKECRIVAPMPEDMDQIVSMGQKY